jgi:transcriptional regulator GlxA family with amidase domain
MDIAIPIFDRLTALDAVGPYEVLSRMPEARVTFLAAEAGPVRTDNGMLTLVAERPLTDLPEPEVVLVPGGVGSRAAMKDQELLGWVRHAHEHSEWTTSVCTGSLVLGAAGILDGLEATTYWTELETLAEFGAKPTKKRVVEQGKVVTAAGVSSGIDMALVLVSRILGDQAAEAIQLGIEYDPQPPFDSGSVDKAAEDVQALVRQAQAAEAASL